LEEDPIEKSREEGCSRVLGATGDPVVQGERKGNSGVCACNGESGDTWPAKHAVVIEIDVHQRRGEPGEAMGHRWDEEALEQPINVFPLAPPDQAHPERAEADEAETHP